MSRTVLVVSSSLLLAIAGCAELDAGQFPGGADAGGAKPGAGDEPEDEDPIDDERPGPRWRRPDASADASTRGDAGTATRGGLDASAPAPAQPRSSQPSVPTSEPAARGPAASGNPAPDGEPSVTGTSRGADANLPPRAAQPTGPVERPAGAGSTAQAAPPAVERASMPGAQPPPAPPPPAIEQPPPPPPVVAQTPALPTPPPVVTQPPAPPTPPAPATTVPARAPLPPAEGDDVVVQRFDVRDPFYWVFLDLETGRSSIPAPIASWDIALRGVDIMLNGGVSGDRGVTASVVRNADFAAVTAAPGFGWTSDAPDGTDSDQLPELVLSAGESGWWNHDAGSATFAPKRRVYVVKTTEGTYFKLAVLGYYDDDPAQTPGFLRLQWSKLAP